MYKKSNRRLRAALFVSSALLCQALPAQAQDATAALQEAEDVAASQEGPAIVVTGSRTARSGVNMPTPVRVVGQDLITQTGATQLAQVINDLPGVRATVSSTTAFVGGTRNGPGNNLINLRGLGATRTLVLVDGLRYPATTTTGLFNTDLIPTSLVSRVDIVTGGASAAYGSDAIAGVVNIVLDDKLTGLRGSAQYGVTDEGDGQEQRYSIAGGHAFAGGRVQIIAGLEYQDRKAVGNCYSRAWCAEEWNIMPNPTSGTNGLPAFIIAPEVRSALNTPAGLIVNSNLTAAYGGQQVSADGKSLLPFTFGQYYRPNSDRMIGGSLPGINPATGGFYLQQPQEKLATFFRAKAEITETLEGWIDAAYGHTESTGSAAQLRSGNQNATGTARAGALNAGAITLSINNPFLPAALVQQMQAQRMTTVNIGKSGDGLLIPKPSFDVKTFRGAVGLKGRIGGWEWDAAYLHGESRLDNVMNNTINTANFTKAVQAVNGAGANAGRIVCSVNQNAMVDAACAPLNLFGIGTASSESLAYAFGTATQFTKIKLDDVTINVRGAPFSTGAGDVDLAIGLEYRNESVSADADPISLVSGFVQSYAPIYGSNKVLEVYGEANMPLLKDVPMAELLEVNGAIRHAKYTLTSIQAPLAIGVLGPAKSDFNALTWKAGIVYKPSEWLRFRGTISRDFRAPNIDDLYFQANTNNIPVLDPVTKSSVQVPTLGGGNPFLSPEIGKTKTVGVTFKPSGVFRNFELSVDYYDIKVTDYIARAGAQALVTQCFEGVQASCQFVTRNASQVLTGVLNPVLNVDELEVAGVDVELGYRDQISGLGEIDVRVLATTYSKLKYVTPSAQFSGRCQNGQVAQQPYPSAPCYDISARFTLKTGPAVLGAQVRYIPKGKFNNGYVGPQDGGYDASLSNSIDNNRVPATVYVDLNGSYRILEREKAFLEVFSTIRNALNKRPQIAPANDIGTNANLYDVIGRTFRIGVRFSY